METIKKMEGQLLQMMEDLKSLVGKKFYFVEENEYKEEQPLTIVKFKKMEILKILPNMKIKTKISTNETCENVTYSLMEFVNNFNNFNLTYDQAKEILTKGYEKQYNFWLNGYIKNNQSPEIFTKKFPTPLDYINYNLKNFN